MRSLIVGDGYLAGVLAEQLRRFDVSIERVTRRGGSGLDRLLGAQRFDQVVVAPEPGSAHSDGLIDRVDGPRWVVCSWARDGADSPAGLATEVALQRGGTVLGLSTIFGRGGDDTISQLARFVRRFRTIVGLENDDRLVQPLHVDDLSALIRGHLHRPSSGCVEVAGPEALPVAELWQSVAEILGVRSRSMRVSPHLVRLLDPRGTVSRAVIDWRDEHAPVDIRPARTQFGWHPVPLGIRIEQGVHEAIA